LKLCVGRPSLNWGYTDGALLAFEERGFYLHTASAGNLGKRYWFGTKPTLTKLLVQYRGQLAAQTFDPEMLETLEEQVSRLRLEPATWRVLVNPQADLPEQRSLTLLIMPPECTYAENGNELRLIPSPVEQRLLTLSQQCGSRDRHYRNTLLFLLPSARGLTRLRSALREVTALEAVQRDYGSQLDAEQREDLHRRLEAARKAVSESLGPAYTYMARIDGQNVVVAAVSDPKPSFAEHLQKVWRQVVEDEEWVVRKVGAVTLQKVGLVPTEGGIRVKDATEAFLRYTDKPMIASREAVLEGLRQACREKLLSIGRGIHLNDLQRQWCGEDIVLNPNEDGLWIIPSFAPQPVPAGPQVTEATPRAPISIGEPTPGVVTSTTELHLPPTRQIKRVIISGAVSLENWAELFRCFVNPAGRMHLKRLQLGIHFEMEAHEEQPFDEQDPMFKAMQEAARQLGLELKEE
jgi:hypothetical protein